MQSLEYYLIFEVRVRLVCQTGPPNIYREHWYIAVAALQYNFIKLFNKHEYVEIDMRDKQSQGEREYTLASSVPEPAVNKIITTLKSDKQSNGMQRFQHLISWNIRHLQRLEFKSPILLSTVYGKSPQRRSREDQWIGREK